MLCVQGMRRIALTCSMSALQLERYGTARGLQERMSHQKRASRDLSQESRPGERWVEKRLFAVLLPPWMHSNEATFKGRVHEILHDAEGFVSWWFRKVL